MEQGKILDLKELCKERDGFCWKRTTEHVTILERERILVFVLLSCSEREREKGDKDQVMVIRGWVVRTVALSASCLILNELQRLVSFILN